MKYLSIVVICVQVVFTTTAQTRIPASEIINKINNGQSVEYSNAIIEGDLDLTDLRNRKSDRPFWFSFNNDTFESYIGVPLKFTNCTFIGDVLAYYHIERRDETYIAHFEEDVAFKNCTFKRGSEFKYSKFRGATSFAGSTFNEEGNFKYAKFNNGPLFSNVRFESGADFKYTKFPPETSFEKATFRGLANFKYTEFKTPLNIGEVAFKGTEDFKYTEVDGRSFTAYLLSKSR
ncbi:MAG: pentapeptide repeat-containing protein [Bacteroidota bacterium]